MLLASEAPVGIVFRRGPSKLVRVILWDREKDQFTSGQWFKGRIYPDRSDISPDGRHMIYFAMGGVAWAIPKTGGTWTAISRVPSLTALSIWPQGHTWGGGGIFISNTSYWMDGHRAPLRDNAKLKRVAQQPSATPSERDRWTRQVPNPRTKPAKAFEKQIPRGWTLRRITNYQRVWHELDQRENGLTLEFPTWEWADWDRKRLVWAEQGSIRAARIGPQGLGDTRTLCDLNSMTTVEARQEEDTNSG